MALDFKSPLIHKCLGRDNQSRASVFILEWASNHQCNRLDGFTKSHVICKNSSFVVALFFGLHPSQANLLMLHQRDSKSTWCLIIVRFSCLSNIFDTAEQVLDIFRKLLLVVGPILIEVRIRTTCFKRCGRTLCQHRRRIFRFGCEPGQRPCQTCRICHTSQMYPAL